MSLKKVLPAADRNKEPILSVLKQYISKNPSQKCFELSSGTGQHLAHFAPNFPEVTFYPSEFDESLLESIKAYTCDFPNVSEPMHIDASTNFETWPSKIFQEKNFDYIYNCNLIQVSPFACTYGLFRNSGKLLKPGGFLFTYGPYAIDGKIFPESNVEFDKKLRSQNSEWGIRDLTVLKQIANDNGIQFLKMFDLPANNKVIIWQKNSV